MSESLCPYSMYKSFYLLKMFFNLGSNVHINKLICRAHSTDMLAKYEGEMSDNFESALKKARKTFLKLSSNKQLLK
jgi:hypothetical protein